MYIRFDRSSVCFCVVLYVGRRAAERHKKSRPERSIYIPGQSCLSNDKPLSTNLSGSPVSSHCTKSAPLTNGDSDPIQTACKSAVTSLPTNDKNSHSDSTAANISVLSQRNADSVTCKTEPAGDVCDSTNDLKRAAEKQPRSDRRQRQGKRPDIQLYVPKPKQSAQHGHAGNTVSGTAGFKPHDNSTPFELDSAPDWTRDAAESRKSAVASLPQSSAIRATSGIGQSPKRFDVSEPHKSRSTLTAKNCNSTSQKSSTAASLSRCFDDLSLSANKTTEHSDSSECLPDEVKQKVSKLAKSQNSEPKQELMGCILSSSGSRNTESDRRGKSSDSIRSENLDWDFDGEFEYNLDGVNWGDLPPPSDHELSDEECCDDYRAPADSATDTQTQKPRRPHAKRRRGTRKKQILQNTGTLDSVNNAAAEEKLSNSRGNSNHAVRADSFESGKLEKIVTTACQSAEGHESPADRLSLNDDADDRCSVKAGTGRYLHLRQRKDATETAHLAAVGNESEQRTTGSREQRNVVQIRDKQQSDASLKESKNKREEDTQRQWPDSGRVGGIIRLPVGIVTTAASHVTARSSPPQVSASGRGRCYRSVHGGRRARWHSGGESESFSSLQHQGSVEPSHVRAAAAYPAHCYQRQSASPQLYYTDYPAVSGASQMPPTADGYVYSYPHMAYDGHGYVDDSYYH